MLFVRRGKPGFNIFSCNVIIQHLAASAEIIIFVDADFELKFDTDVSGKHFVSLCHQHRACVES
jgi:hypothetical protein